MSENVTADPATTSGPLATVQALLDANVSRDADAIVDCYANDESIHVFVEGPRWQTLGYEAVARGWRAYCESTFRVTKIETTDGFRVFVGDDEDRVGAQATVAATTRLTYQVDGEAAPRQVDFRLTWVLRREADRWRIIHEHGSQPGTDPYGTGDWLPEAAN